ncbi:tyrosine-type recombinase/integrase [Paractinoplanes atraurantiacus]|uniref:Integrase/recombinase XerC n=1 Tax=Paractinoplanes atraurantiacus TaxID=1036182 RepID=A0A285KJU2_9ACTN|nr:tyrosine-type recombinase/integrase [Actinoplanes atraurantiacus]SNY72878.1 integrase/recombinase XerC [Actinoplanes atraurantiacus]
MSAEVIALRPGAEVGERAGQALATVERYLDRCKLSDHTKRAYRRYGRAYVAWLAENAGEHADAFADVVGAEAAVTAWRRRLTADRRAAPTINQALAAVDQLYEHGAGLRLAVDRARVPRPGAPDALTPAEESRVQRAARRRGARDHAIIELLRTTGARVEELARLDLDDVAVTERTGQLRLHGKGDEIRYVDVPQDGRKAVRAWLDERGREAGPLWIGQRGRLTVSGLTQVVLAVGADAGLPGLRPHRLRHTYATRLRKSGADPAQIQALLGHASIETSGRYFRAGAAELAAVVEKAFDE